MNFKDYFIVVIIFALLDGVKHFVKNLIGEAPNRKHEKNIEEMKSLKAYELQVDSYYRDISNESVSSLMGKWWLLAFDNEKILTEDGEENINIIKEITNDTIFYGSKETIKRLAAFQNYNYKNLSISKKADELSDNAFIGMYLISYVISSLKKDFTGEGIEPDDLLKIKLTDYDENKNLLSKAHEDAREILNLKE